MSTSALRLLLIGIYFLSFSMIFPATLCARTDWENSENVFSLSGAGISSNGDLKDYFFEHLHLLQSNKSEVRCMDFAPNSFEIVYRGASKRSVLPTHSGGGRIWANLYYDWTKIDPKGAEESKSNLFGVMLGLDLKWTRAAVMSFYYHYGSEDFEWNRSMIDGDVKHHQFGMSYQFLMPMCHLLFNLNGGYDQYDYTYDSYLKSDPDGYQVNFFPEFGLDIPIGEMFGLKPFLAFHYHYLHHDRFVDFKADNYHGFNNILGMRTNVVFGSAFLFQVRAAWIHEFLDASPTSVNYFGCTPGQFTPIRFNVDGSTARNWAWLGTGMKLNVGDHLRFFADYDLTINARQTSHLFSLCFCLGW